MIDFAKAADRPLNWNVLTVDSHDPERYRNQLAAMDRCRDAGAEVVALTMPILVGMNMSFLTYCALNMMPDWGPILGLPPVARLACLRDPDVRRFMEERAASPDAGVFARLTGWDRYVIGDTFADPSLQGRIVGDLAAERGVSPFDALLDVVVADELRTVLWPGPTDDDDESWKLRAEAWDHPSVMIGGSDAGAHLDRMCGPPYTTQWIGDCLRGRRLTTLERAVQHLTETPGQAVRPRRPWHGRRGQPRRPRAVRPRDRSTPDRSRWSTTYPAARGRLVADADRCVVGCGSAAWPPCRRRRHRRPARAPPPLRRRHDSPDDQRLLRPERLHSTSQPVAATASRQIDQVVGPPCRRGRAPSRAALSAAVHPRHPSIVKRTQQRRRPRRRPRAPCPHRSATGHQREGRQQRR